MRTFLSLVAVLALVGADAPADAVKKEMSQLEGEWTMISGERDGQPLPDNFLKDAKRVAKDGVSTISLGDMVYMKAKFSVDPTKKPKAIDYEILEGPTKGKKVLGIYEIDGDKVKFCFAAADKDRPSEFTAKAGSGNTLSVWKRKKE
jgi:uncharacterized protein (TIGR03067 family)